MRTTFFAKLILLDLIVAIEDGRNDKTNRDLLETLLTTPEKSTHGTRAGEDKARHDVYTSQRP
jgi:hypothetical protein